MNKAELVQAMADEAGLSKSDAEKALNAFVEVVGGELGKVEKYSWLDSVRLK
jgi:DNA-binding protein HU-beta